MLETQSIGRGMTAAAVALLYASRSGGVENASPSNWM